MPNAPVQFSALSPADLPSSMTQWVVLGVGIFATAFVLLRPKMRAKKDPLVRQPASNSLAQQRSVERQMQNLLVELSEMARQITAGLDTRASKLDLLIREADEKIAALTALNSATLANGSSPPAPAGAASLPAPSAYEPDPRHLAVYNLADEGRSTTEIAGQLNRPNGEIELILALRPRTGTGK